MKTSNPAGVIAAFVSAVSLILPTSAMSADDVARLHHDTAPEHQRSHDRARSDPLRDDPILNSTWGPGDPGLAVPRFRFDLSRAAEHRASERH